MAGRKKGDENLGDDARELIRQEEQRAGLLPRPADDVPQTFANYDEDLAITVLNELAEGDRLTEICQRYNIARRDVYRWIWNDVGGFASNYKIATAMQMESWGEKILEIADDCQGKSHDYIQAARVRISTRQWMMERLASRRFGPKGGTPTKELEYANPMREITPEMEPAQAAEAWSDMLKREA